MIKSIIKKEKILLQNGWSQILTSRFALFNLALCQYCKVNVKPSAWPKMSIPAHFGSSAYIGICIYG